MERKIIHIDMDAFFASVEQRDNPQLRGKPIAIGADVKRGVVATASYEARPFGVHSAMSMQLAKRLCPHLIVVPGRYQVYKEVSRQMHAIFHEYTDIVEPISLDEAFLDVTENKPGIELAVDIAREIKTKIKERLNLTASAGVSYNKFLAKIASDQRKPDGLCTIHPSRAQEFIDKLRIEKFWLVGPKTAETMHKMGIFTGADLRAVSLKHLIDVFGKMGPVFYNFARGIDDRPVVVDWERKSMGCEHTFEQDLKNPVEVKLAVSRPADNIMQAAYVCHENQKLGIIRHLFKNNELSRVIIFAGSKLKVKEINRSLDEHQLRRNALRPGPKPARRDDVPLQERASGRAGRYRHRGPRHRHR